MKLFTTLLIVFYMSLSYSQSQYWGVNTESAFTNEAMDIEIDGNGNSIIAGYITGETAFENSQVFQQALGNGDIYVAKYSTLGTLIWVKKFGGSGSDRAFAIAIDSQNNILISGQYNGTVQFGSTTLTSVSNSRDIFLAKLNPSGDVIWAKSEGGAGVENVYDIAVDAQNNIVMTGQFSGNSTLCNQSFVSQTNPTLNAASFDLFVSKFTESGSPIWVKTGTAKYEDRGLSIATDANNNIFLTGQFSDTLAFAGQTYPNNGYNIGFISKLSSTGAVSWFHTLRGGMVVPYSIRVSALNEIFVGGDFRGTLIYTDAQTATSITNPYLNRIFALKINTDGDYIWSADLGSDNELSLRSIAVDNTKNVYATGYFTCGLTELQQDSTALYNSVGFRDLYCWKIDFNGQFESMKQIGGKKHDIGRSITIKNGVQPLICGSYTKNLILKSPVGLNVGFYNQSLFNLINYQNNIIQYYLQGDDSPNSFISALNEYAPYNYFINEPADSLDGHIVPDIDTVHFCNQMYLGYNNNTKVIDGPDYTYLWSSGQATKSILINTTNTYIIEVEREDGCVMDADTIVAIKDPNPILPLLYDSLELAIAEPGGEYYSYNFCYPDSVAIWFENLDTSYSLQIYSGINVSNPVLYTDTSAHYYTQEGDYYVLVDNGMCQTIGHFSMHFDYELPYDTIDPKIKFTEDTDYNDSIQICSNQDFHFFVYDYLENPLGTNYIYPNEPLVQLNWYVTDPSGSLFNYSQNQYHLEDHQPTETGWYVVHLHLILGYNNLCGIDTTHYHETDSIYVEVLATPSFQASLTYDNLLCPNGSVYIMVNNTHPNLNWGGNGITWESTTGDSIQATQAGTYSYSGHLVDSITGCSINFLTSILLEEKEPPTIILDPVDGIVCPYDSVTLVVPNTYVSYEWFGPSGNSLSTDFLHIDDELGFYYCVVEDAEGCFLTTLPAELREYTSPYLSVSPTYTLCEGDQTTIEAIIQNDGTVNWISPIQSNAPVLTVTEGGWFVAELSGCGITVLDSVEIIDGAFTIQITATDSTLCSESQYIQLTTDHGYNYTWNDNNFSSSQTIAINEAGTYQVVATNNYGCEATSNSIEITDNYLVPSISIADQSLCQPGTITLVNYSGFPTHWYDMQQNSLGNSASISLFIDESQFVVVTHEGSVCPSISDTVFITFIDSIPSFSLFGDTLVCLHESAEFCSDLSNASQLSWTLNGNFVGDSSCVTLPAGNLNATNQLVFSASNSCYSVSQSVQINVKPQENIELLVDSIFACLNETVTFETTSTLNPIVWTGGFGEEESDELTITATTNGEQIYVHAFDDFGCITATDTGYIFMHPPTAISIQTVAETFCIGDSISLLAITPADSVTWQTPSGNQVGNELDLLLTNSNQGNYSATILDSMGCSYSASTSVSVYSLPEIEFSTERIHCLGSYFSLTSMEENTSYFANGVELQDSLLFYEDQWITIEAENEYGCVFTDSIYIQFVNCHDALPNVFTPNGDGKNDLFVIDESVLFPTNYLIIFNRWGNVVYEQHYYQNTFTGENLVESTYFYIFYRDYANRPEEYQQGFFELRR